MPRVVDDKSKYCISFLLERLEVHKVTHAEDLNPPPFFLGVSGIQGSGKTALVSTLRCALSAPPYSLPTISFSLDDIYLTHAAQQALAASYPSNPLLQHRGQPSTHDIPLGRAVFNSLRQDLPTAIPAYDKSSFAGQGDRVPAEKWEVVNDAALGQEKVKVVIFEGWCVGFRSRPEQEVCMLWEEAVRRREEDGPNYEGQLGCVALEDCKVVNEALRQYDVFTDQLDALIHIDAQDTHFVYDWRQEQERKLLATKGSGMTIEEVNHFVNGYYPSYELFTQPLRQGAFKTYHQSTDNEANATRREHEQGGDTGDEGETKSWRGRQLRLVIDKTRRVCEVIRI